MNRQLVTSLSLVISAAVGTIACGAAPEADPSVERTDMASQSVSASDGSAGDYPRRIKLAAENGRDVVDEATKRAIEARAYPNSPDADGDGFYDAKYGGTDCCDTDAKSHPGVQEFFNEPNACRDYDYNCDGKNETEYPTNKFTSGLPVHDGDGNPIHSYCPVSGFDGMTYCGLNNYFREYTFRFLTCHEEGFWRTQGCR